MNLVKFSPMRPAVNNRSFDFDVADRLFNDFFGMNNGGMSTVKSVPPANVMEEDKNIVISLAVPGMKKTDFNIKVEKNILSIEKSEDENKVENEVISSRTEFDYSSFERSFRLGKMLDVESVRASYDNGILSITIAKKEEAIEKPARTIKIS